MKTSWGVQVQLHVFLILASNGGKWSASRPGRSNREETDTGSDWMGSEVGPRTDVNSLFGSR
jgi:hypothetical protein